MSGLTEYLEAPFELLGRRLRAPFTMYRVPWLDPQYYECQLQPHWSSNRKSGLHNGISKRAR